MSAHILTQCAYAHDSGLPRDRTINTMSAVIPDAVPATELADWHSALATFFAGVGGYLANTLAGTFTLTSYRRADPEPRVPVLTTSHTFTPGADGLPAQVSLVLSFQAARAAGQSQARRRGRIYLGPITAAANVDATGRPTSSIVSDVAGAGDTLLAASVASANFNWEIWSEVDGAGHPVDNGWVDNRWDTQRRRALQATSRTTFS